MDHLQRLKTFVAVAESGSFAHGARLRDISAPAATKAIASLEQHLGVLLLLRTTRSLRLTEQGESFLADCKRILADLDAAEAAITGVRSEPRGTLAITAPAMFGSRHVAPLLFEFLGQHPALRARALFTNRLVHLVDEGLDVAVRIAALPDSGMTAVPIGTMRSVIVASPAYLKQFGTPHTASDLKHHRAIGLMIEGQDRSPWSLGTSRSTAAPQERLVVNANDVKVAAAVAGQGLISALAYQVIDEVRDGRLQLVLEDLEPPAVPMHLVYPAGRSAAAKVREFVRFAAERLSALPVLQGQGLEASSGRLPTKAAG